MSSFLAADKTFNGT